MTKATLFALLPEHTAAVAALSVHASTKDITSTIFPALLAKEKYSDLGTIALLTTSVDVYAQVVAILLDPARFSAVCIFSSRLRVLLALLLVSTETNSATSILTLSSVSSYSQKTSMSLPSSKTCVT